MCIYSGTVLLWWLRDLWERALSMVCLSFTTQQVLSLWFMSFNCYVRYDERGDVGYDQTSCCHLLMDFHQVPSLQLWNNMDFQSTVDVNNAVEKWQHDLAEFHYWWIYLESIWSELSFGIHTHIVLCRFLFKTFDSGFWRLDQRLSVK